MFHFPLFVIFSHNTLQTILKIFRTLHKFFHLFFSIARIFLIARDIFYRYFF